MRVGIDIGRVISCPAHDDGTPDTSFILALTHADAMATPIAPDCIDVIKLLVRKAEGNVWLISKAGQRIESLTRDWLAHINFFGLTGVNPANLIFVRKREEKQVHARELMLTDFIDDRSDILLSMHKKVPNLYLFGPQKHPAPPWVIPVKNWTEVAVKMLLLSR